MRVLITGASGFIGAALAERLLARGHHVRGTRRHLPDGHARPASSRHSGQIANQIEWVAADFARDHRSADWLPRVQGIDVVVNAAGVLRDSAQSPMQSVHDAGPRALFEACVQAGVQGVVQISALGADADAASDYHRSKRSGDAALASLPLHWVIVQPSLVYGPSGTSARLFDTLASLPLIALPGRGMQQVQPIHIDDAVDALVALIEQRAFYRRTLPLVGPAAVSLRGMLAALRQGMGLGEALWLPLPMSVMQLGARLGEYLPGSLLDRDTLAMLERGNTASAYDTRVVLGRPPRAVSEFIPPCWAGAVRSAAQLRWLMPLLRWSIALLWIITAWVSVAVFPLGESYALLGRVGVPPSLQPLMLYGAAGFDLLLGLACLLPRRTRFLWVAQIALVLLYTLLITWRLPEFWAHPYGPLLKNLPILAALGVLLVLDRPPDKKH